eukprot:5751259-Amphidinium_carterae.1
MKSRPTLNRTYKKLWAMWQRGVIICAGIALSFRTPRGAGIVIHVGTWSLATTRYSCETPKGDAQ